MAKKKGKQKKIIVTLERGQQMDLIDRFEANVRARFDALEKEIWSEVNRIGSKKQLPQDGYSVEDLAKYAMRLDTIDHIREEIQFDLLLEDVIEFAEPKLIASPVKESEQSTSKSKPKAKKESSKKKNGGGGSLLSGGSTAIDW